jgi:hypothetical protein
MYTRQKNVANVQIYIDPENINFEKNFQNPQTFSTHALLENRMQFIFKIALLSRRKNLIQLQQQMQLILSIAPEQRNFVYRFSNSFLYFLINTSDKALKNVLVHNILFFDCNFKMSQFEIYLFLSAQQDTDESQSELHDEHDQSDLSEEGFDTGSNHKNFID